MASPEEKAAMIGGGASLAGSLLSSAWSAHEASKNRKFQERMSSTAHQREVADLRKAGLNPILSAMGGSGAQAMTGSLPSIENVGQGLADLGVKGYEAKTRKEQAATARELAESTASVNRSQEQVNSALEAKHLADALLAEESRNTQKTQQALNRANTIAINSDAKKKQVQGKMWDTVDKAITPVKKFIDKAIDKPKKAVKKYKRMTPKYNPNLKQMR